MSSYLQPRTSVCDHCRIAFAASNPMIRHCSNECRFWSKVAVRGGDECWLWLASKDQRGYGHMCLENRGRIKAHRFSVMLRDGGVEPWGDVLHRCDNPSCVNPDHLWIGTMRDNIRDARNKGRLAQQRQTHCAKGHEFSPSNTKIYSRSTGKSQRVCLECKRASARETARARRSSIKAEALA